MTEHQPNDEALTAARREGQPILAGLRISLPSIWIVSTDLVHPKVQGYTRFRRPASYGYSDVTAFLVQELCGGRMVYCGDVEGERRYANELPWCGGIDLMLDPFGAESIVADGTLFYSGDLAHEDRTFASRFQTFRLRILKHLLATLSPSPATVG